jgi:phosphatidyl-myo-inositol dimannoside synthase
MKVLFLALGIFRPIGGMENFNQRVMRVLSELKQAKRIESATIISLWDDSSKPEKGSGVIFYGYESNKVKTLFTFLEELLRGRPDLVIYGHILFTPLALVGKVIHPKGKTILFVHGIEVWEKPSGVNRWMCGVGFDRIIAVSQYTARKMALSYQLPASRFSIIFNAIDYDPSKKIPTNTDKQKGKGNILSVSRLSTNSTHKKIDKVIEAMPEILRQFPNTHYTIIGDGDWQRELENLAIASGVGENVHFTGWLDDLERNTYYETADIFILPSVGEGFGIVFLEAWQHFLPVITSNQGAANEVVRDGIDGICIEPIPEKIAEAIIKLLSNEPLREEMSKSGNKRLKECFTHGRFMNSLLEIIEATTSGLK